jgi:hypothetical protein
MHLDLQYAFSFITPSALLTSAFQLKHFDKPKIVADCGIIGTLHLFKSVASERDDVTSFVTNFQAASRWKSHLKASNFANRFHSILIR